MQQFRRILSDCWASYLKDVFERMARKPTDAELAELLPNVWLDANPTHRWEIADKRREEREK